MLLLLLRLVEVVRGGGGTAAEVSWPLLSVEVLRQKRRKV